MYTNEQIERAKNVDIADFMQQRGYEIHKDSRNQVSIKNNGGLVINPNKNEWYWHSKNVGGKGVVTLLQNLEGLTFPEAMRNVIGEDYNHTQNIQQYKTFTPQAEPEKPKEFQLPEKNSDHKGMYAYLAQTRKISPFIINEFIKQNLIYQEKATRNAVFLHKDDSGKTVGAELRGTSSDPTKKFARNAGEKSGFRYTKGTPDKAFFFESAIDLMSFLTIEEKKLAEMPQDKRPKTMNDNSIYVSMAGLTTSIVKLFADKGYSICLCVDNDEAGENFAKHLSEDGIKLLPSPILKKYSEKAGEPVKDYNELLQKIVEIETEQKSKSHEKPNEQHLSQIKNIAQNNYSQKKFPQRNEANSQKNEKV
jgi:hypothetical protein